MTVQEKLNNGLPDHILPVFMTFSARTSANQTQDLIDSKMDKRRKGVFGPPSGKRMVIALDDMNMPLREKYFAQPPIEILRQWMDHKGWYERKPPCAFRQLVDVQYVGCMGPPGGGRNPVSNRFLRHFNFVAFAEMSDNSVCRIFDMILSATLERKFSPEIQAMSAPMVAATVEMYNQIRLGMLPTPAKSHYTFNLRDLARVIQGVLRAEPKEVGKEPKELLSLWLHENLRVFSDRLVSRDDVGWFQTTLSNVMQEKCGFGWDDVVQTDRLMYGDYLVPGADPRVYSKITDMAKLRQVVEESLEDYNSVSTAPMKLVQPLPHTLTLS